jgi:hypothetical protein
VSVQELLLQFDVNFGSASEVCDGLTHEQFNWHPEPGRWSIAQCLAHLNVVNGQDVATVEEAIRAARAAGIVGQPPFQYGFLSRKFIASMLPPVRTRMKAPKSYVPPPTGGSAGNPG